MMNKITYLHKPDFQVRVQNEIKTHHLKEVSEHREEVTAPMRKTVMYKDYKTCLSQEKPFSFCPFLTISGILGAFEELLKEKKILSNGGILKDDINNQCHSIH